VAVKETDLYILAQRVLEPEAREAIIQLRQQLEAYINANPQFQTSLVPLPADPRAPQIVKEMLSAAQQAGVGPMAGVAGAMAAFVGAALLAFTPEVVVENGGDIFVSRKQACTIAIFAGASRLSNRVGLKLKAAQMPCGVCTSSATVGHSLSLGRADAVTVVAASAALADAAATRIGNIVKSKADLGQALAVAGAIPGLTGVVIIIGEELGAWGQIELVEVGGQD